MRTHGLQGLWNEGLYGNFTHAFRCTCGYTDNDYIQAYYAYDAWKEHREEAAEWET